MKTGFILHFDSLSILDELSNEQAGILFKAIKDYSLGVEPELDFAMRMAFIPFKNQFKRDDKKYDNVVERNRNNGAKGGRPKKPKETQKTQSVILKPKKADNKNNNNNKNINNNFIEWFNKMINKHLQRQGKFKCLNTTDLNNLKKLKKENYEPVDWEKAFISMSKNNWVIEQNMCNPSHFLRPDNFQRYVNQFEADSKPKFSPYG